MIDEALRSVPDPRRLDLLAPPRSRGRGSRSPSRFVACSPDPPRADERPSACHRTAVGRIPLLDAGRSARSRPSGASDSPRRQSDSPDRLASTFDLSRTPAGERELPCRPGARPGAPGGPGRPEAAPCRGHWPARNSSRVPSPDGEMFEDDQPRSPGAATPSGSALLELRGGCSMTDRRPPLAGADGIASLDGGLEASAPTARSAGQSAISTSATTSGDPHETLVRP